MRRQISKVPKEFLKGHVAVSPRECSNKGRRRNSALPKVFEFDGFRLDTASLTLAHGSQLIDLPPKALEILSVLVSNAGSVVLKDDLLNLVWPDAIVEEGNLTVHVSSLRKALSKYSHGTCQIQTVPKRGYWFAASVRVVWQTPVGALNDRGSLLRVADHYLLQNTISACRRSTTIYQRCIEQDPANVKARTGLADTLLMRFIFGDLDLQMGIGAAVSQLAKASEIHPQSAEVHLSRSRLHCVWDLDWQRAADELQQGLELAADDVTRLAGRAWQGVYLARLGDLDRGLHQLHQASQAFPLSSHVWFFLAEARYLARDFTGSIAASEEGLQLHPHCWYLHASAARPLAILGEYAAALQHLRLARVLCPEAESGIIGAIACVHAMAGKRDRAARLLARLEKMPAGGHLSLTSFAMIHAALGDTHRALEHVEAAGAAHEWYLAALQRDSCMDGLRTAPRFRAALSRAGISS
jgi:DNA-binding winged helix-turn-helix (wHTH) protein